MEFRILGPFELAGSKGGGSVEAPKLRALLGVLLLHANEVVSSERLIDELWGERPPASAGKIVQTYISQLRRALGPDAIVTRAPGYLLRVESDKLDAQQFRGLTAEARSLAARGDHAQARPRFCEALALWRGPPLSDVHFESFARNEVEQLEEERLSAVMDFTDCELALGHHDEVVAALETLVRQHPLRERLRGQLMLALYRCGRQADALAAYRDARRTLVDELGLEPSRELQDLEQAILTHDASLELPRGIRPARPYDASQATPGTELAPVWMRRGPVLSLAVVFLLAIVIGVGLRLDTDQGASPLLAPNSVGFIDVKSGRITKSFPVGREPRSISVSDGSVWVANYEDETVTRIAQSGGELATIPVGGHPTGLASRHGDVWVWTLEGRLAKIDSRFNVSSPVQLGPRIARLMAPIRGVAPAQIHRQVADAQITSGGGFLWVTVPLTTVIRIDPAKPRRARFIVPADGVEGAIAYRDSEAWVAGYDDIFPITASTGIAEPGTVVGLVRSLAFVDGDLWVVSSQMDVVDAVRRVNVRGRVVVATIPVRDSVAVASAGGSVWVASRRDQAIRRVRPSDDRVVETIGLGAQPSALAADAQGVWVAVR